MASGSHYGGFFGRGYKIGFDWSSSRVGNENASNVTVVPYLYIKSGYSISSSASKSGTVTINGTNHNFNFTLGNVRGETWVRLSNGFTTKVGHNSDGSKSCTLKVSATLNLNLSGSQIGAVSDQATVTLDKFNLNSAPTMPTGITVNPNGGYIPENGTSITISWSKASDPDGNLSNHILDCCKNGTWMTWATLGKDTTSYTDTIPKGEGDTYQYRVIARDSAGLYSNHTNVSAKLTTNTLRGGSFSNAPSISDSTSSITMNFSGGSNTDGTAARYMCYSDDITIYNQTETTSGSQAITIYKSGSTPSGPYIRFDDLKNRFKNSNYNGRMHIGLRTGNGRGTYKYSSTTLSVDLRSNPLAPGAVTILQDSNSTAYKTHSGTGSKYFVPDGTNHIRFTYTAASDPLGGEIKYKLYQIYNGNVSLLADNVTGVEGYNFVPPKLSGNSTATLAFRVEAITSYGNQIYNGNVSLLADNVTGVEGYNFVPPKLSGNSTATLAFRVEAITSYGRSSSKDSAQITLHSYNGVSFSLGTITRTATDATVNITVKTTSSVPNINTVGTWSCNSKSGNLAASQSQQSFKVTGLTEGGTYTATVTYKDNTGWSSNGTYTATVTYKDNTGWSSNQTASISIGSLLPVVAITKEGLGVGGVEATSRRAANVKGSIYPQGSYNCNTVYNAMPEGLSLIDTGEAKNGAQYDYSTIMSVCHSDNRQFQLNVKNDGNNIAFRAAHVNNTGGSASGWSSWKELYHTGKKPTANDVGALPISGGTLTGNLSINGPILSNNDGSKRLKIQTAQGNLILGPNNADWCHFDTDRAKFWFSKPMYVQGEIYAGSGYNQRVYHQGFKPTPGDIGAAAANDPSITGNIVQTRSGYSWIYHINADIGSLNFAPRDSNGNSDWAKQFLIKRDGNVEISKNLNVKDIYMNRCWLYDIAQIRANGGFDIFASGTGINGGPLYMNGNATIKSVMSVSETPITYDLKRDSTIEAQSVLEGTIVVSGPLYMNGNATIKSVMSVSETPITYDLKRDSTIEAQSVLEGTIVVSTPEGLRMIPKIEKHNEEGQPQGVDLIEVISALKLENEKMKQENENIKQELAQIRQLLIK